MAIRIRVVDGVMVALCAARSVEQPGDIYIGDAEHAALAEKFREDFTSEGATGCAPCYPEQQDIRWREESNNVNREWWDSVYGTEASRRPAEKETPDGFTRSELHLIESACANRANDRVYAVNVPELQADKAELVRVSEKAGRLAKATPEASRRPK